MTEGKALADLTGAAYWLAKCELLEKSNSELVKAPEAMLKAYNQLMPGLVHIAVQDYANINEAPIIAKAALTAERGGKG